MTQPAAEPVHLRAAGVSVVLAAIGGRLPAVLHWGADLGELTAADLTELADAGVPATVPNDLDQVTRAGIIAEHAAGWNGRPGLAGQRAGRAWSPLFTLIDLDAEHAPDGGGRVLATGRDPQAGLDVHLELELLPSGLLRQRATVAIPADADAEPFVVDGLALTLPVPPVATELFDLAGRWGRERAPQRAPFVVGIHSRENRRGRTGPDAPLILAAGTAGFGFSDGEVWAVHVAWSGNHVTYAERLSTGASVLGGGELLLPGEVRIGPGESYTGPWVYAAHATGLDGIASRFHTMLRARPHHPGNPRPVVMNTWEAVYFDHDLDRLVELARVGADVGVERYVLDDGWFRHRRSDHAGLGDWYVDEGVWPEGLHPLVREVRQRGMEFGLWVEPEMVNPDSDLARAHPDWILQTGGRMPIPSRQQQVLDLAHPDAYAYILERLDALLTEYPISYLKWDHNRDLVDAGHGPDGVPGVHAQTRAVYRLIDEVRARHPGVEIESCSSGGLRVDLEILERTDRIWGSDMTDPLERQQIQRWTAQLIPPELVGSHVAAPRSHSTARTHDLSFRAGTALFGSFGIEWDVTATGPEERKELAAWVQLYKDVRGLIHTGSVVRGDQHDQSFALHGAVAPDRSDALYALVQLATPLTSVPGQLRLPGLDPDRRYRVTVQPPGDRPSLRQRQAPAWLGRGVELPGRVLAEAGLRAPALNPEQLLLLRVTEVAR
ncbi:alpha-galactosidase [Pseudonocardia sp. DSM 110487]|uniref:alpha-galactosidase n=1 Tax=Pseudonocardia sp. DSM 110487 TaxID=2865833 RepID=UPI001C69DC82|nr:alpha-galactosidase [Pseudonocardia sp. DSM 110487]QYN39717.1 alpha-galactosidase [Pseudonocardia sp. DSM 110487]